MTISKHLTRKLDEGFTLVELLIVIVVIAILAAITIVAYNGIQNRAKNTAYLADATNIDKKAELLFADTGSYPQTAAAFTGALGALPSNVGAVLVTTAPTTATQNVTTDPTAATTAFAVSNNTSTGKKTYAIRACGATTGTMIYYADSTTVRSMTAGASC